MTQFEPTLLLNRLVIVKDRRTVYDEPFHSGVNIIRGQGNSVGKSTIANMIFYALGGDAVQWVEEARVCDAVMAEVIVNGTPLVLNRAISDSKERPMSIFWGNFDSANKSSPTEWQTFPFSQRGTTQSFSQVIFRALGIPEVRGDLASRVTMNQLLRLLFCDQQTPSEEMFRQEKFSRNDTLDAVGSLLCGTYDDRIYEIGFELQQKMSERDEAKGELKT
jgi:hypothetical protein